MNLTGLRKWSITVVGVCAVVGITAILAYHGGLSDFQFKLAIGAVITLTSTGTTAQAFLDYLDKKGAAS